MYQDPKRRYLVEIGIAGALYIAAVFFSGWLARHHIPADSSWRYALVLIPLLPSLGMLAAVVRYVRRMDELQQRIHLEAAVIAVILSAAFCITIGLLQVYAGFPDINLIWVMAVIIFAWGLGGCIARRKYA